MSKSMTSLERVLKAMSHQEADRVPLFLLFSMYGAKELNLSIEDYYSDPKNVVRAQIKLREKYGHDCFYTFYYASIETEAWGGEVIFSEDGPPNSGKPIITERVEISDLKVPDIHSSPCLNRVLETTRELKRYSDEVPIIGVVMSPFSLPVMQMGFDKYIEMIYEDRQFFDKLMEINEEFCIRWANAQLEAGATAICYFNPVSSTSIIPKEMYKKTGFQVDKRTISRINGPTVTHVASGRCLPIIEEIIETGTLGIGVSTLEDIGALKEECRGKLFVFGNLDGIEMCNWDEGETKKKLEELIEKAGSGGGLAISDNHGEIPWQVPEKTLLNISKYSKILGLYPSKDADLNEE
ncbi:MULTISPECIES: uroporphyrinogen decarboxylase family protein [Psychrilyobacter]|uniref:Methylcobamide--CoM methyltransferase MtbA n=1 Tax=Psychrilyobacter piezotolerans TaxID=2293438 RepID=A0ABX9KGJ1_9FUSO|nr:MULTISPECIES: uroporphyrinogen decarboxylase family protein [Psychrilyobacter]MCS5420355.1 uroporphyrinogen decarboxylase family protein [Psychrilyobacter sp. S5]NDI78063.1 methylcobamide--CoM methyltransferase MtbA [Psychrilyobacter piezotolerans]RDE61654.1 methylcobamide--CoM methyltransferase MtbA [Psychrilyobacter sp. S5]REI41046.1 methylcobamide--CoM methyltransferase MtbA [Psychrilyobacter piezotolerans]